MGFFWRWCPRNFGLIQSKLFWLNYDLISSCWIMVWKKSESFSWKASSVVRLIQSSKAQCFRLVFSIQVFCEFFRWRYLSELGSFYYYFFLLFFIIIFLKETKVFIDKMKRDFFFCEKGNGLLIKIMKKYKWYKKIHLDKGPQISECTQAFQLGS